VAEGPLTLRSPADDINVVHAYIERVWAEHPGLGVMDRLRFETALIELAANVIQHADDGNGIIADITISVDDTTITGNISDSSPAGMVDMSMREMPDEYAESGRGIAFIQRLVDVFHYERRDDENFWVIIKRRAKA
jgi:serine/threonine-protein kinase RsbW